jgi:hypothetical protein
MDSIYISYDVYIILSNVLQIEKDFKPTFLPPEKQMEKFLAKNDSEVGNYQPKIPKLSTTTTTATTTTATTVRLICSINSRETTLHN